MWINNNGAWLGGQGPITKCWISSQEVHMQEFQPLKDNSQRLLTLQNEQWRSEFKHWPCHQATITVLMQTITRNFSLNAQQSLLFISIRNQ